MQLHKLNISCVEEVAAFDKFIEFMDVTLHQA